MHIAKSARALLALSPLLLPLVAHAGPNEYVISPIVEQGEKEIEFKWGTDKHKDQPGGNATSLGFGVGVTSWWATELSAKWKREPGESHGFDAVEWENRFQLTPTGKYPVDAGFLLEIERPKDRAEGYELTYGPLLQAEWGAVQGNLNLLLQKHVRASESFDTELHYQVQLKYRQSEKFEWGAQGFGSFGRWDKWAPSSQQEHKFGPAIFGKIKLSGKQAIKYNAAILFGTNDASPRTTLRLQTEYEF
jgi:hypothetical protein